MTDTKSSQSDFDLEINGEAKKVIEELEDHLETYQRYLQNGVLNLRTRGLRDETIADIFGCPIEDVRAVQKPKSQMEISMEKALEAEIKKLREKGEPEIYIRDYSRGFRIGYREETEKISKNMLRYGLEPEKVSEYTGAPIENVLEWQQEL